MKQSLSIIIMCFGLIYLPLTTLQGFLLYQHVHATDLMWFLYWIMIPMGIISGFLTTIQNRVKD